MKMAIQVPAKRQQKSKIAQHRKCFETGPLRVPFFMILQGILRKAWKTFMRRIYPSDSTRSVKGYP